MKQWKCWGMSCDVDKGTEGLENELWSRWSNGKLGEWAELYLRHSLFSNPSIASPTTQLILQHFHCFTYIAAHSWTLLSLLLHYRLFTYITWQAAHEQHKDICGEEGLHTFIYHLNLFNSSPSIIYIKLTIYTIYINTIYFIYTKQTISNITGMVHCFHLF